MLTMLQGDDRDRAIAVTALGKVAQADLSLADKVVDRLLPMLDDRNITVRSSSAKTLGQIAFTNPASVNMVFEPLLRALKDDDQLVRTAAADAFGKIAEADNQTREKAFYLLTHYDGDVRNQMRLHFVDILLQQAEKEQEPGQFLLDHLEGRRLLMGIGDIHTNAAYRDVVIESLARWLTLDKDKPDAKRENIRHKLEQIRDHSKQLHLRISAWRIFVAVSKYREEQREERDKE